MHVSSDSDISEGSKSDTDHPEEGRIYGCVPDDVFEICQKQFELISPPLLKALAHIPIRLEYSKAPKIAQLDVENKAGAPPVAEIPSSGPFWRRD